MNPIMKTSILALAALGITAAQSLAQNFVIGAQQVGPNPPAGTLSNVFPNSGGENPEFAIDGNSGTKYLNFARDFTGYIITPAAGSSVATGLSLMTANDSPARDPLTYSLYGSNTAVASNVPGTTYDLSNPTNFTPIVLNGSTGFAVDPGRQQPSAVQPAFVNALPFTTYVLFFPTVRDPANANSMQIAEAQITGTVVGNPQTITATGDPIGGGQVLVPEPGTAGLLGLGALGLAAIRRRR